MEQVTLYNHNQIGDLPVIPNIEFKKLIEGITSGTITNLSEFYKKYSFVAAQKSLIEWLLKNEK